MKNTSSVAIRIITAASLVVVYVFFVWRNYGASPFIMPDEYVYSTYSRFLPLRNAQIPSYLYYLVYSITAYWGDNYLDVARMLNVFFYVSGSIFVFLIAKNILTYNWAVFIMFVTLFMPTNFYISYFMPESMYFCFFWVLQYVIIRSNYNNTLNVIIIGVIYGFLILIKPHAWFLLPIYLAYFMLINRPTLSTHQKLLVFIISFLFTRFIFGYFIAGLESITFFGDAYSTNANLAIINIGKIINSTNDFIIISAVHLISLSIIFGIVFFETVNIKYKEENLEINKIVHLLWLHLIILIPIISLFTVIVSLFGGEWIYRIHMRYYIFVFPYFLILVTYNITNSHKIFINLNTFKIIISSIVIVVPMGVMYYYNLNFYFHPFTVGMADIPEIFLLIHNKYLFYIICSISMICLALWFFKSNYSRYVYLLVYIPLYITIVWYNHDSLHNERFSNSNVSSAGQYLQDHVSTAAQDSTIVIGYSEASLLATLMYAKSNRIKHQTIHVSDSLIVDKYTHNTMYILTLDSINLHNQADLLWRKGGSMFYKIRR